MQIRETQINVKNRKCTSKLTVLKNSSMPVAGGTRLGFRGFASRGILVMHNDISDATVKLMVGVQSSSSVCTNTALDSAWRHKSKEMAYAANRAAFLMAISYVRVLGL